jgi:tripartite ATP-independent transporter DctM subunit
LEPAIVGIICLLLFFLLVFLGMPIGFSFAIVGFLGFIVIRNLNQALGLLGLIPYSWCSGYMLVVIPLFVLMGQFAFHSGISGDLYSTGYKWVGRQPGGLALATQLACTGFAACSGSSLASAATMGVVSLPEMKKYNYSPRLATASVAAGGTLGILIPPSIIFIVYGLMTETSIGKLFIAGIIPGLILSSLFLVLIYVMCRRNPQLGPCGPHFSWNAKFRSLWKTWGMLALFLLVIGGIYFGIFTPTEAGAIGAFGAFLITIIRRRMTRKILLTTLKGTVQTTAMIFMIVIGAQIFNSFLALSGVPAMIAEWIAALPLPRYAILVAILLLYIPLGMVMDALPMILLTLPTLFPVVVDLGFDPILFGVLVVLMSELANISPPMGMNLYIVKGVAKEVPIEQIILGVVPFAIVMLAFIAILIAFPQISLFLPGLMR